MPYIDKRIRHLFDDHIDAIVDYLDANPEGNCDENCTKGNMNYVIFAICKRYLDKHGIRYSRINDLIGAIECSKMELNRRIVGPYEDQCINRNGDVI